MDSRRGRRRERRRSPSADRTAPITACGASRLRRRGSALPGATLRVLGAPTTSTPVTGAARRRDPVVNVFVDYRARDHPARAALAGRRGVGLLRGRPARLAPATRRQPGAGRGRPADAARGVRRARRCASGDAAPRSSGPPTPVAGLWDRLGRSGRRPREHPLGPAAPRDRHAARWSTPDPAVRRQPVGRRRHRSTRPASRCTPRRSASRPRTGGGADALPRPGRAS